MSIKNFLITGPPGSGKTTVIKRLSKRLEGAAGFYTEEIREAGARKGFLLKGLNGKEAMLAHVDIKGGPRVGKYGVDVKGLERFLQEMDLLNTDSPVVLIDEIGKMECFSGRFVSLVRGILDSEKVVVATVAMRGAGLIEEVKKRKDSELLFLHRGNRSILADEIIEKVSGLPCRQHGR